MNPRRLAVLCAAFVAVPIFLFIGSAQAATHTVTLNSSGPSPAMVTIARGDSVTFKNADNGAHTITHNAGAWSFTASIPPGGTATTTPFTSAGSFGYDDSYSIALLPQHVNGSVTVTASTPSPTRSPTASPRPIVTHSPQPTHSPGATPAPTVSGVAITPGLGVGSIPPPPTSPPPNPSIAPPLLASSPSTTALALGYGEPRGLIQSSPHRYGLPAMLALIGAIGVLSLLVRLLLSLDPAGARRW